jgi:hypothetical protein
LITFSRTPTCVVLHSALAFSSAFSYTSMHHCCAQFVVSNAEI